MRGPRDQLRDLPKPPRRSDDNYLSALIQTERTIRDAQRVCPDGSDVQWLENLEDEVRAVIRSRIDAMGTEGDADE